MLPVRIPFWNSRSRHFKHLLLKKWPRAYSKLELSKEHDIFTYLRVDNAMKHLGDWNSAVKTMKMTMDTPLAKALNAMSCIPIIQSVKLFEDFEDDNDGVELAVSGVNAGALTHPNVDVIVRRSMPSSFGRDEETVNLAYRREIPATDIGLDSTKVLDYRSLRDVKKFMFPAHEIHLKLYKLFVYETGGHLDWHRDDAHSEMHQGTLLLALNTSWEGGDLILRRNSIEKRVDLQPQIYYEYGDYLQAVAFFKDTEYRVEPVKSGILFVLQYNIEVAKKQEDEIKSKEESYPTEGEEESEDDNSHANDCLCCVAHRYYHLDHTGAVADATSDQASIDNVISIIKELHGHGDDEVAFALQHLYRKADILPEYLKGSDAALYNALLKSGNFDITLHPVLFVELSGGDEYGRIKERYVYVFENSEVDKRSDLEGYMSQKEWHSNLPTFHIPKLSGIVGISSQSYNGIYKGIEAMPAEYRYFGGGMFIRPKAK